MGDLAQGLERGDQEGGEKPREMSRCGLVASSWTIRCVATILINCTAAMISDVTEVTGYTGALFMSMVAFVLPAIFHAKAKRFQLTACEWLKDSVLVLTGISGLIMCV